MIEKVTAYKTSDGKTFEKIDDVQRHEIERILIAAIGPNTNTGVSNIQIDVAAAAIVGLAAEVIDVLSTGPRSKPKARSINGGRKTRTPKIITSSETAA